MAANSTIHFGRNVWSFALGGLGRTSTRSTTTGPKPFFNFVPFSPTRKVSTYNVRRSCTSGGLLLLGLDASGSSTQTVVAGCTAAAESAITGSNMTAGSVSRLARQAWIRKIHNTARSGSTTTRRAKSTQAGEEGKTPATRKKTEPQVKPLESKPNSTEDHESITDSMTKYLHLPHLPKMPHRPTKEELLAAATGFWQRLKVRFKWFSIRSTRPYNADEWGAFLSWIIFGHFVWILVGTTTFFSLLILLVNTIVAQGW